MYVFATSVGLIHDLAEQLAALFARPDRHKEHVDVSAAPFSVAFGALGICYPRLARAIFCHMCSFHVFMACQNSAKRAVPDGRSIGLVTARQSGFLPNLLFQRDMCSSRDMRSRTDTRHGTTSMLLRR